MANELKALIKSKIFDIEETLDYWQFLLDVGAVNFYSPLKYCDGKECYPFSNKFIDNLIGKRITKVDQEYMALITENKKN